MSTLQNKIDFAIVLRVNHANPNGDPLNGNRPRTDYDGLGEITDVCLKRKIRDRLQENGKAIFVQSDDRKNDDARSLRERAEKALGNKFGSAETATLACATWMDVRTFGQLFALPKKKKKNDKKDTAISTPNENEKNEKDNGGDQVFLFQSVVLYQSSRLSAFNGWM